MIRQVYDTVSKPIVILAFKLMPMRNLSYIAGFKYASQETLGSITVFKFVAAIIGLNFEYAPEILNNRLASMKNLSKKDAAKLVWSSSTASSWNNTHFNFPEERSKQFVYQATKQIQNQTGGGLSVLELGSVAGGSFHCLKYLNVEISRYLGIDISEKAILEGRRRFKDVKEVEFIEGDFLEVVRNLDDSFDVLIVNLTFLFLEENYLRELFSELKRVAKRIVISEKELPDQIGKPSQIGNWGNSPLDYSHDYGEYLSKAGYTCERGGIVDFYNPYNADFTSATKLRSDAVLFEAVYTS
jgi:SAM-dependent methyltransferase